MNHFNLCCCIIASLHSFIFHMLLNKMPNASCKLSGIKLEINFKLRLGETSDKTVNEQQDYKANYKTDSI